MKIIKSYLLYDGYIKSYYDLCIPEITKLSLPKNSQVLSVLATQTASRVAVYAYVEEVLDGDNAIKIIALVTANLPKDDDLGWRFLNSFVLTLGKDSSAPAVYHAYVKIC